ncbi:MAG: hypothetical protein P8X95_00665 [Anaerolineales bacterium]|jgi:uncharacterized cupredoxin-like copper-binding protein
MLKLIRRFALIAMVMLLAAIVLAACGGGPASNQPVDVTVTETEFSIESSMTTFEVGVAYHFVVTNNGTVNHEFDIMPPEPADTPENQVQQESLARLTQDNLPPGTTATLDYTFTKPYPAGSLEFACHVPGHYDAGMHLPVIVK